MPGGHTKVEVIVSSVEAELLRHVKLLQFALREHNLTLSTRGPGWSGMRGLRAYAEWDNGGVIGGGWWSWGGTA